MSHPIVCNLSAINVAERPAHAELARRLRQAIVQCEELPDGYSLHLDESALPLVDLASWVRQERLCCPFLVFAIEVGSGCKLTLRGPEGSKAILYSEFVSQLKSDDSREPTR